MSVPDAWICPAPGLDRGANPINPKTRKRRTMMKRGRFLGGMLIGLLILLGLALTGCGGGEATDPAKSREAAILEGAVFVDFEGNEVQLADYAGKFVLIDFWETWCGPCLQVFPAMQQLREEYPEDFVMLAVTVGMSDTKEDALGFIEENEYDFTWLYDENEVFVELGAQGIPFKAYIGPDGEVIDIEMGSRGKEGDYNVAKAKIMKAFAEGSDADAETE